MPRLAVRLITQLDSWGSYGQAMAAGGEGVVALRQVAICSLRFVPHPQAPFWSKCRTTAKTFFNRVEQLTSTKRLLHEHRAGASHSGRGC